MAWIKSKSAANPRSWLVSARLASGLTQGDVAASCGISRSSYQKYEYGERTPRKRIREQIDHLLSVECNRFDERLSHAVASSPNLKAKQENKSGGINHATTTTISAQDKKSAQHQNAAS